MMPVIATTDSPASIIHSMPRRFAEAPSRATRREEIGDMFVSAKPVMAGTQFSATAV